MEGKAIDIAPLFGISIYENEFRAFFGCVDLFSKS